MNPELKRNLTIELTRQRLIAMPVILGLVFTAAATAGDAGTVATVSRIAFWALILLWGTRKAAGVFDAELLNNTWDGQRMSALSAMELFLGKLFGGLGFILYGASICVVVSIVAQSVELADINPRSLPDQWQVKIILSGIGELLAALLAITTSMFVAVILMKRARTSKGISVTLCQFFAIGAAALIWLTWTVSTSSPDLEIGRIFNNASPKPHIWYGIAFSPRWFAIASLVVFLGWAVTGIIRELGTLLQFRSLRWMWLVFVLFAGVYVAGFEAIYADMEQSPGRITVFLGIIWAVGLVLTYIAIFIEPKSINDYRTFLTALGHGSARGFLEKNPFWVASLAVALVALILVAFIGGPPALNPSLGYTPHAGTLGASPRLMLISLTLFALRDYAIILALNFRANAKRADLAALIYLMVLYFVAPIIVGVLGEFQTTTQLALGLFRPQPEEPAYLSILPIAIETVLATAWVAFRWRNLRRPGS